jgi:hypothetical protein
MPQKLKLNQRREFKTWRFTGTLTPTHHINEDIHWIATNNIAVLEPHIQLVKACIRQKIMNQAKPGSVTFISWRFSRAAAASWVSKAKDKVPLPDLPFEGYIQSTTESLSLPRLHRWIQDAIWENVSGKLSLSRAYQEFSAPDDAFEYDNDGSPALSKGGRRKTLPTVSTDSTMSIFHPLLTACSERRTPLIQAIAPTHTPPPSGGTGGGPGDRAATLSVVSLSPPRGDRLPSTR